MSRKVDLPAEVHVRAVLTDMRTETAAGGAKPSVLALARRLGLSNATFWRHFRDIATDVRHEATVSAAPADGENLRPDRAGNWPARMPGCAETAIGWLISWRLPSAICGG